MKSCTKCKQHKSLDEFSPHKETTDGRQSWCKPCCKSYAKSKYGSSADRRAYAWAHSLMRFYGMTVEQYEALERKQNGVCAICEGPPVGKATHLHVDHCHTSGRIRGLLCGKCNTAIAFLGDSPALLKKVSDYFTEE